MRGRPYIGWPDPVARAGAGRPAPWRACRLGPLVARGVGDRPPLSPFGGATGPVFFFLQGLRCKFEKKIYILALSPHRATGVYF